MGILSQSKLKNMGFASLGENLSISDKASFYNCSKIHIGSNSRIDDFCVISAGEKGVHIGRNVHIGTFCNIVGKGNITFSDFSGISSHVSVFSSSDDYSGLKMTNPTIPDHFTGVSSSDVLFGKHVIVGAGSVILPGITLEEGAAVGALSLVTKRCKSFSIYTGNPIRFLKKRKKSLLDLEKQFLKTPHHK